MLRKIRVIAASVFFTGITLLLLDVTGYIHLWLGWMAKIQFLPAALALNLVTVAFLVLVTLLMGRVYCSVICPLGIMQDIISWSHGKVKKRFRYRFGYKKENKFLRYGTLLVFIICLALGVPAITGILAPYSSFGRIAENLFAPVYGAVNNLLAWIADRAGSYTFYSTDVWIKSIPTFIVAVLMFIVIFVSAWRGGRMWCNSICPVGTILGFFSRFSIFVPQIDTEKCRRCGLCGKACKSSCIDMDKHQIDYSRCVVCMDCLENCKEGAIRYGFRYGRAKSPGSLPQNQKQHQNLNLNNKYTKNSNKNNDKNMDKLGSSESVKSDSSRRGFISATALLAVTLAKAQNNSLKNRLAPERKHRTMQRETRIVPAGSVSLKHFSNHCTACQLCVNTCPNDVLRPSSRLESFMQPEMSFERGYCRPECSKCSEVCPAGAIRRITPEEKSSIQIGHAVIDLELCVVNTDGVRCGNCAKHCPSGAILMVLSDRNNPKSLRIPAVNEDVCIGCGACENLCPSSPYPAIHIEGHEVHKTI